MGDELIKRAAEELKKDRRSYFCIDCGRPRYKNYCPWNSAHPEEPDHHVTERGRVSMSTQVHYFLKHQEERDTKHVFR